MSDGSIAPARRLRALAVPAAPALLAVALAIWSSARTAMWRDEYATAMYASLSPSDLLAATSHVDGVIAPYYLVMHALAPFVGHAEGLRVLSIVAFAATAAVVAIIARRWWGGLPGLLAGAAFAVSALALSAASLARPYATSMLLVALAVLAVDRALARRSAWMWVGYAAAACGAVLLQPLASLSVVTTAVLLAGRGRASVRSWILASIPAGVITIVVLLIGAGHSAQLSWLDPVTFRSALQNLALALGFSPERQVVFDGVVVLLFVTAIALAALVLRGDRLRSLVFSGVLALGPPVVLFVVSLALTPILSGRYLTFSAIGAALSIAGTVAAARTAKRRPVAIAAGALGIALLILSAGLTAGRVTAPASVGDDVPWVASKLKASAEVGDLLVFTQRYEQGGLAYGFAVETGDAAFRDEILAGIPGEPRPVLDVRRIVSTDPLRTIPAAGLVDGHDTTLWLLSIWPPESADPRDLDPTVAACINGLDPDDFERGASDVRLYRTPCPPAG